jgi:hypothetical protein
MLFVTKTSLTSEAPYEFYSLKPIYQQMRELSTASDHTYRPEHCTGGGAFDLIHPEDVSELVRLVGRQILQVLVLQDVDALPHEKVAPIRPVAVPAVSPSAPALAKNSRRVK